MNKKAYPAIDIIIPFKNNVKELSDCMESILRNTLGMVYTLTFVDDGSVGEYPGFLKKLENYPINIIKSKESKGFGHAVNIGINQTHNTLICVMHSDCKVKQVSWLRNMVDTMVKFKDNNVKLVSARMDNAGSSSFDERVIKSLEKDCIAEEALPLVCCLFPRSLLSKIDGGLKEYSHGGFENEELFWRMKIKKFNQAICCKTVIGHIGKNHKYENIEDLRKKFVDDVKEFSRKWVK